MKTPIRLFCFVLAGFCFSAQAADLQPALPFDNDPTHVLLGDGKFGPVPATSVWLRDVQSQLAKLQAGSNVVLNIGLIGDSWFTGTNIVSPIRQTLQNLYGDAGPGWVGVIDTAHIHIPMDVTRTVTGTWTNKFSGFTTAGAGMEEADSGVMGDRVDWTTVANTFVLHYKQKVGGGYLAYSIDDGSWTNVDTSIGTTVGICGVSNAATASHKFSVMTTNTSTGGITLYGVDIQRTNPGVRVHALGVVGRAAIDRSVKPFSTTYYQPGLSNLNLNLMVINYGNNDKSGNLDPALFARYQHTNVTMCTTVLTNCAVMVVGTPDTGPTNVFTMADYRNENEKVARTNRVAFLDAYTAFGPIENAIARGMYSGGDNRHLSTEGGKAFAALISNAIISPPPTVPVALLSQQLFLSGTTNQVSFGGTNTPPSSSVAPTKWISVIVAGESGVYRLPLYQ